MAGLTEALAIAMGQEIAYDEMGNHKTATLMDFFLPTAWETPNYDHRPHGHAQRRITRSAPRAWAKAPMWAGCRAFSNAVHDAFRRSACGKATCRMTIGGSGRPPINWGLHG